MRFAFAIAVLSTAIADCTSPLPPPSPSRVAPTPVATPPSAIPPIKALAADARDREALRRTPVVGARLLSGRSLSLKLWLEGGGKAVFKPMRKRDNRARYEVAAALLAEHLGVAGVPAAVMRSLSLSFLSARVAQEDEAAAERLRDEAVVHPDGMVSGAVIDWVDDIDPGALEALGGFQTMKKWLEPARPRSDDDHPLADDAARMVVFDFLIGNWDRLSGGNLFVSAGNKRLILIDHNGTFADWPDKRKARMEKLLQGIERFPAGLTARIRRLTQEDVSRVLAGEPWHARQTILDGKELDLLFARRDYLLQHIDSLVARKGGTNVLVF